LPSSVERALADGLSLEHPDVPWSPPAVPPASADLRAALQILEAQAAPATPKHVAWCLAKLMMAFEPATKLSGEETKLRAGVWLEACGDLGDALWTKATLAAIQSSKWMPKPAEFRKLVEREIDERSKRLQRCRAMLDGVRTPSRPVEQPIPTRIGRLMHTRSIYERMGRTADVERIDREIAAEQGADMGIPTSAEVGIPTTVRPPFAPADTPTNRRLAELAASKREGRPPAERRDIPEAAHG
jgi:hypothetical protein